MTRATRLPAYVTRFSIAASILGAVAIAACGSSPSSSAHAAGTGGNTTGSAAGGASGSSGTNAEGSGGGISFDGGPGDGGLDPDAACATQSASATLTKKPVDVIVVIDNSGSMTQEIEGVQQNINQNFASILENSGLDYRVIMLTRHGSASGSQSVCIEAPLSGIPAGGCTPPPPQPVDNPPRFFHYSVEIASHDSWCKILSTFDLPDEFNLAPNGWQEWLRPDSFKTFVEITDDDVSCKFDGKGYNDNNSAAGGTAAAAQFDADLMARSPAMFGDAMHRNYAFYSIVALGYNTPADKPYGPMDPVLTTECPTAAGPGTGYQALSVLTGALRFPICDTTSYDVVFQAIAQGVIDGAKVACDFAVPDPPPGKTIDLTTVEVLYTPGMGAPTTFVQVPDEASCKPGAFYIDGGTTIRLCPDACALVQNDDKAKIDVLFGCSGGLN